MPLWRLIDRALGGRIIGAIARDATEIEAREKPVEKDKKGGPSPPSAAFRSKTNADAREKTKNDSANSQSRNQRASSVKRLKKLARCSRISPPPVEAA